MHSQQTSANCKHKSSEPHSQKLRALYEMSRALCASHDLDCLLRLAVRHVVDFLAVESCAVLLLDAATRELQVKAVAGNRSGLAQSLRGMRFPVDQGIAGWVARTGEPTVVPDVTQDARFCWEIDALMRARARSYLCVPLKTGTQVLGVLIAVNKRDGAFAQADAMLPEAFASQLAIAVENARLRQAMQTARERLPTAPHIRCQTEREPVARFATLIGESPGIQEVYRLIERILHTATTVLITGESGTGKELVARAIHAQGSRAQGPFVAINCAAIPETLIEAELFGYERGAFTGALQPKPGRFELAAGGTLFLDEIGEMRPALQAKLLRVLQEKTFERLGSAKTVTTDSRIIAATNQDLSRLMAEGTFRADLFYRLNVYPILLPPLRERPEDILPLTCHFLKKYGKTLAQESVGVSREASELLVSYNWPGNIRELEHVIERAMLLCTGNVVTAQELPLYLHKRPKKQAATGEAWRPLASGTTLAELEKRCILQALEQSHYNQLQTGKLLGLSRTQLRTRMKNFGIEGRVRIRRNASVASPEPLI